MVSVNCVLYMDIAFLCSMSSASEVCSFAAKYFPAVSPMLTDFVTGTFLLSCHWLAKEDVEIIGTAPVPSTETQWLNIHSAIAHASLIIQLSL